MRILLATGDESLADHVRESLWRFRFELTRVADGLTAFQTLVTGSFDLALLDFEIPPTVASDLLLRLNTIPGLELPPAIVFIRTDRQREQVEEAGLARTEIVTSPVPTRALVDRVVRILRQRLRVACIGGGTGLFTLLRGLKTVPGLSLVSIVSMSDDGGSTGRLRDCFGVLPPGDVRRSLVALSSAPDLLNELMNYRFVRGGELEGHNLGNLILTALAEMRGGMSAAVRALGEILGIHGEVVPVTEEATTLKAELLNGEVIEGENRIDLFTGGGEGTRIRRLWCDPPVRASADARRALREADLVILGPGDLFTSVIANLVVGGIPLTIRESGARTLFVCNVMTEPGETPGFSVGDHVREVLGYLGGADLDHVLASTTTFAAERIAHYAGMDQHPVVEREGEDLAEITAARIHRADVASATDLVRHDSLKLARALRAIVEELRARPAEPDDEEPARSSPDRGADAGRS